VYKITVGSTLPVYCKIVTRNDTQAFVTVTQYAHSSRLYSKLYSALIQHLKFSTHIMFKVRQWRFGFTQQCHGTLSTDVRCRKCLHLARQENLVALELVPSFLIMCSTFLNCHFVIILQTVFNGGYEHIKSTNVLLIICSFVFYVF